MSRRLSVPIGGVLSLAVALITAIDVGALRQVGTDRSKASAAVADVWALEDAYWRYVQAGDVEKYLELWHDDFVGWPCGDTRPSTKAGIGDWVKEVRDQKVRYRYSLTKENAVELGNVVVVYYRTPIVSEYPDGHVEGRVNGQDEDRKLTHTWVRTTTGWKILGGMCAAVATQAK